jgi:arginase family enzyme
MDPSLVWFDAHGDVHTLASSTSGYLGGMALRMAMGGDFERLGEPLGLRPLQEDRAVLVDARDLDPAEEIYLAGSSVLHMPVEQVEAQGVPGGPIFLHVDVDVIDAAEPPGLRFPANNGPTSMSVLAAIDRLVASGRVAVLDIACTWFDPANDTEVDQRTALLEMLLSRAHAS